MLRTLLYVAGWLSALLAVAGAFLPLVPCTPFALLAAACFARSSPRAMRRLLRSPLLGPVLRDWKRHRGIRLSTKLTAVCLAISAPLLTFIWRPGFSILLAVSIVASTISLIVICRLKTIRPEASEIPAPHTDRSKRRSSDKLPLAA